MVYPLVECIPNFSEGRRQPVIDAIVAAIANSGAVRLLDTSSDADHNRTVVTFAGTPEAVENAAFAAIKTAAAHIDLDQHRGEHPRIGATDVVPFVPLRDATIANCIAIAKRLGQRVGDELNIPIYLYESAATRPDRENLENIRRGEYEGLKEAILTDPQRVPDYGPAELGKAGATVIGARPPLIAFNVYLTTADVEIASKIAKAVRHSNGGYRFVKALGLLVEGRAQVSMNLTNYTKTPVYRVVETVRREAERYGVGIAFTELIGLAPEDAFIDSARWYLQLDAFKAEQLLERRLQSVLESGPQLTEPPLPDGATTLATPIGQGTADKTLTVFLEEVAAGNPTPGGGSVAALAGALASALAAMVGRLTVGRKKYASVETLMQSNVEAADKLRKALLAAVDEDSAVFTAVMSANKLDKENPKREDAIEAALVAAAEVPLKVLRLAMDAMRIAQAVAENGNTNAATDAAVAAHMAWAAVEGAALNVRINTASLNDKQKAEQLTRPAFATIEEAREMIWKIKSTVETRTGLT